MAALTFVALATANCAGPVATGGKPTGNKYGVAASPKVIPDGQPIPKGGGREMVGKPYVVGERTYVPHDGRGYVREGEASWYGTAFHGRLTANGEVFDKESIAAAHPTLPLPSYVRVTNVANRRSMIVRVNDRGPYERGRLIDLSERAADALEFRRAGTTKVRVEYVGRASVKGSDDRKLLATLRTDGVPLGGSHARGQVMLASLDEGASNSPLAFKPAAPKATPKLPDADQAEEAVPAARPAPLVVAARDLGPAPRLQNPLPRIANVPAPVRLADVLPAAKPVSHHAERPGGRLDHSLDLATIPGAARPTPAIHGQQLATPNPKPLELKPFPAKPPSAKSPGAKALDAKSLPPPRPVVTKIASETGHGRAVKA
ncbi:MAG TPA: septal ring lytic transglycosylase RlpA family protein, partial [Enterovirga sp.]